MSRRFQPLQRLLGEQAAASDPDALVWLSASAGTGKTHVLTARVLRLLLNRVDPAAILCLTFTKAGAAEMAERVRERLAHWVRLPHPVLAKELFALGEAHDEAAVAHARTLFARVLDAPGGGLRIQTIHAFCQTLLAAFPLEAGLVPGFRPLDARAERTLARRVLGDMLEAAEKGGDLPLIRDVQALSLRLGEAGAEAYLAACARAPDAMAALGQGVEARLRRALDVPSDEIEAVLAAQCHDDAFDCASLRRIAAANRGWGTQQGVGHAELADRFLAADAAGRVTMVRELAGIALTAKGEPRVVKPKLIAAEPDYERLVAGLGDACRALGELRARAELAQALAGALRAGQAYARAYADAKRAAGAVDFDDLIRLAARLLGTPGVGEWVRFKLDAETDHILVDEAQDTNIAQWTIVAAIASDYFSGAGAGRAGRMRTIFTVGDFKQAIFGFQGTSPENFQLARTSFAKQAERYSAEGAEPRLFERVQLNQSFRSTPPVLEVVDRLIAELGAAAFGLDEAPPPHKAAAGKARLAGSVTLLDPVVAGGGDDTDEESWIEEPVREQASRIARTVKAWLAEGLPLSTRGRPLRPEDVMILVRKRGELAPLIVARLHAEGVPVAGLDRLRLTQPLAVRDLLAAVRFALQPDDDLNLAGLLVSPLVGLTQDELFQVGHDRPRRLWEAVRAHPVSAAAAASLSALLARADFDTPYALLEWILSGPIDGRRRIEARLGVEAMDPIDELLAAALALEGEATPTLQRLVDWFDRGDVEIARDPAAPLDAVRVMTVHGAKGLQAPLVILADATADPDLSPDGGLSVGFDGADPVPVFRPRKAEALGPLDQALARLNADERCEHWRLLYVAATRAEERLVVGGALTARAKGVPAPDSWYAALARVMDGLDAPRQEDAVWGGVRVHARGEGAVAAAKRPRVLPAPGALPDWLRSPAPQEARPPRPLAPSSLGETQVPDPPPSPAQRAAARRGELLHALFERLPALAPEARLAAAERWLADVGQVMDPAAASALARDACAIMADSRFAPLFTPDALAEAPIAAVLADGTVVAGTADRLLVDEDRVLVVDFKTGRRVPSGPESVPEGHLRQMAAYVAALVRIFPDRRIEAALLYTAGPRLVALPPTLLEAAKPTFPAPEQSLALAG